MAGAGLEKLHSLVHGPVPPSLVAGGRKAQPWQAEALVVVMAVVSGAAHSVLAPHGTPHERCRAAGCQGS